MTWGHMTPAAWLLIEPRTVFKILLLTDEVLRGPARSCLEEHPSSPVYPLTIHHLSPPLSWLLPERAPVPPADHLQSRSELWSWSWSWGSHHANPDLPICPNSQLSWTRPFLSSLCFSLSLLRLITRNVSAQRQTAMAKREAPSPRRAKQSLNEKRGNGNVVHGKVRMFE